MKMKVNGTKRLMAMLLAIVMVLSYIPAGVVAEGTETIEPVTLKAEIVREAKEIVQEPDVTEPDVTEPDVTEPDVTEPDVTEPDVTEPDVTEPDVTEPDVTEPPADGEQVLEEIPQQTPPVVSNPVSYEYTYTVTVTEGTAAVAPDKYTVKWYATVDGTEQELTDDDAATPNVITTTYEAVTAKVEYKGIQLSVAGGAADGETVVTAEQDAGFVGGKTVYVGVPFALPKSVLVSTIEGGLEYSYVTGLSADADGNVIMEEPKTVTITETWGKDGVVYAKVDSTVTAEYPEASVSVQDSNEAGWYNQRIDVVVNVNCPGLTDSRYLPEVTADGQRYSWNDANPAEGAFTANFSVDKQCDIYYGDELLKTLNVDTQRPAVGAGTFAFDLGEKTYIYLDAKVGTSGLKTVTINGTNFIPNRANLYEIDKANMVEIVLTSNADLTSEITDIRKQAEMKVSITEPKIETGEGGSVGGKTYVISGKEIGISVTGADNGNFGMASAVVTDLSDNAVTLSKDWTYVDGTWSAAVSIVGTVNGLKVSFTDVKGRTATGEMTTVYEVNTEAPKVTFSEHTAVNTVGNDTDGYKAYFNADQTYEVTVTDANLAKNGNGSITLSYVLNGNTVTEDISKFSGESGTLAYTISLDNGDTLTDVRVTAVDNTSASSGEEKDLSNRIMIVDTKNPEITAEVTGVDHFVKKIADGTVFGVASASEIAVTVVVKDENLDFGAFAENEGWDHDTKAGKATRVFPVVVEGDTTGQMKFDFANIDLATNVNKDAVTLIGGERTDEDGLSGNVTLVTAYTMVHDGSKHICAFNIDRRAPGSAKTEKPKITLSPVLPENVKETVAANGNKLYNGSFSFEIDISDSSEKGFDSGVQSVIWAVEGKMGETVAVSTVANEEHVAGKHIIPINVVENVETNEVELTIDLKDNVGNIYPFAYKFAVDTLKPRVKIDYISDEPTNGHYYNNGVNVRTATVTIEDLNLVNDLDVVKFLVNGEQKLTELGTKVTKPVTFGVDGEYKVSAYAKDLAGWETSDGEDFFIIDQTAPAVTVTRNAEPANASDSVEYFDHEVTYTVTISDEYLDNMPGQTQIAEFSYTLEGKEPVTIALPAAENGWSKENDTYKFELTLTDGDVLTGMSLKAVDNANNPMNAVGSNEPAITFQKADSKDAYSVWNYTGKLVAVDMTAPAINVTKKVSSVEGAPQEGKLTNTFGGYDYYSGNVTYTVDVKDNFLNANAGTATVVATYLDGTEEIVNLLDSAMTMEEKAEGAEDTYSFPIVINEEKVLTAVSIQVIDNAGNIITTNDAGEATNLVVSDSDNGETIYTDFDYDASSQTWKYQGNGVVSDSTAPVIEWRFSENVKSFFYNAKLNTLYAILENVVEGESGKPVNAKNETVTVTLTAADKNLTIEDKTLDKDEQSKYCVKTAEGDWNGETSVNTDSTVTYEITSEKVGADGIATFVLDVNVVDLAGNTFAAFEIVEEYTTEEGNEITNIWPVASSEDGKIAFNITVDRQRPSSDTVDADTSAPTIEIKPSIEPTKTKNAAGQEIDLFDKDFSFDLKVTDGKEDILNSGIKSVKWNVVDANEIVADPDGGATYEEAFFEGNYKIEVNQANAAGESNEIFVEITAEDQAGNIIKFKKLFGFDTLAPRVTITPSNTSYQNEKYYKADQTISVEITDLNFTSDLAYTRVDTEVVTAENVVWTPVSGKANAYRSTFTYNTDGDYTFAMVTKDLANNAWTVDIPVPLNAFTIDKTAPRIDVTYNPSNPVDMDGAGVQYFDVERSATVTITEHNFRAEDVVKELANGVSLSGWSNSGDIHTARALFGENNNHKMTVRYTDLAGNPAQVYTSPVFSVDKTKPTIVMSKGDMSTTEINPVAGDLVLGFTVEDPQSNLKDVDFEVLFVGRDNNFKPVKVDGAEYYSITGENDRTTRVFDFTNIAKEKANDGIYTVRITATDYSGNVETYPDVVFSLNRFGSTFMVGDDNTANFLKISEAGVVYQKSVDHPLVFKEINPNRVWQSAAKSEEGSLITVTVNGNAKDLVKGTDYELEIKQQGEGNHKWYEYIYSINPEVFMNGGELVDGEYTIFFYSEDAAANKNTNEANLDSQLLQDPEGNYSGKVSFTLDHKTPVVTVIGIEEGDNIREANQSVEINIADNTPSTIEVYINGVLVEVIEVVEGQPLDSDWIYYDAATGSYKLNMSEKNVPQNVRIVVIDAAGNEQVIEINDVMLTENLWYQYINNLPALLITGVLLIALIVLIIILIKRRKKEPEEAAKV